MPRLEPPNLLHCTANSRRSIDRRLLRRAYSETLSNACRGPAGGPRKAGAPWAASIPGSATQNAGRAQRTPTSRPAPFTEESCRRHPTPQIRTPTEHAADVLVGKGSTAIWGRASRARRKAEGPDERGDAMFGAQGAEPAPLAGESLPTSAVACEEPTACPAPMGCQETNDISRNQALVLHPDTKRQQKQNDNRNRTATKNPPGHHRDR